MSIYSQHWQGFGLAQGPRDYSQSPIFSYDRQDRALPVRGGHFGFMYSTTSI